MSFQSNSGGAERSRNGADLRRLVLRTLLLMCLGAGILAPAAAPQARAEATAMVADGYARFTLDLPRAARFNASVANGVLVVRFDRTVAVDPAALARAMPDYISVARLDDGGRTLRAALKRGWRIHTSRNAAALAIDLVSPDFSGDPPDIAPTQAEIDAAAAEALRVLSYKDENAILSFLSTPLTEVQENRLLVYLGRRLAALRATWVQRLFLEKIPSDSVRNRIVAQAADYNSGAISDPFAPPGANVETSLQLLALQGDVGLKRSSLMRLGSAWSRSDKAKAAQWLQNQPPSLERDWAANGFVAQIVRDNPTEAQNWLRLIQSREAKTAAIKNIALHWLKKNSGAAQAWLNVQRLSPEDLADIHDAVRHASVDGAFKPDGVWTVYP